jgi:Cof subfamily protein (haloacid dehalogenase superfamily)
MLVVYRLIAIDLDDTLLASDLKISDANKNSILKAIDKGVLVTIATGRMYKSVLPFINELKITVPVIAFQGAYICNPITGELIDKKIMPKENAKQIIMDCIKDNTHIQLHTEDSFYFAQENEYSRQYEKLSGIRGQEEKDLYKVLDLEPIKMIIMAEPDKITALNEKYQNIYKDDMQIVVSKLSYLEFTHIDATKGRAVEKLSSILGIKQDEIICIGDSYNDISMIQYAALGVAMANAPQAVKEKADYISKTNDEDGVAAVINKFILGEVI